MSRTSVLANVKEFQYQRVRGVYGGHQVAGCRCWAGWAQQSSFFLLPNHEGIIDNLKQRDLYDSNDVCQCNKNDSKDQDDSDINRLPLEKLLALAMGTHLRLGLNSPLRFFDLSETGFARSFVEAAMTIHVPEHFTTLRTALLHSCDYGWPILLSPGTYSLDIGFVHTLSRDRPLIIKGAGKLKTVLCCTWQLFHVSGIFEDLTLLQGRWLVYVR